MAKSFYRIIGTLVGAAVALFFVALFAQERALFLGALALWIGLCTFGSQYARNFAAYSFVPVRLHRGHCRHPRCARCRACLLHRHGARHRSQPGHHRHRTGQPRYPAVQADVVSIAPDISVFVDDLRVKDNRFVQKGDILFVLDGEAPHGERVDV